MIIRSLSRRPHALLSTASACCNYNPISLQATRLHARHAHQIPSLGRYNDLFAIRGVPGLYEPPTFNIAWNQYQGHILARLNAILAGDPRENMDTKTVLLNTARDPATANTFNYASMAHNNHFYFSTLSPTSVAIAPVLSNALISSFSSLHTLKSTFLATAGAMFGPGFVWLVQYTIPPRSQSAGNAAVEQPTYDDEKLMHFRILTTYLAGSPYPGAHTRQQPRDLNNQNLATSAEDFRRQSMVQNSAGAFGMHSGRPFDPLGRSGGYGMGDIGGHGNDDGAGGDVRRFGGADIIPVLCVNTWEHAWMIDWGVGGKRAFLEAWWDKIDWDQVGARCHQPQPRRKLVY